ncbi:ribonuclease HI [Novosphingobium sp.]|uniref:ribonuclease HI n=1 Tax=Novosphingobium sp. TaxID=1874826 RepID=UPI0035AEFDCA
MRIKVYFDGGCRPNPGRIELAVVLRGQAHVCLDAGLGNSHDAEWLALIEAVRLVRRLEIAEFVLLGDALAVIGPATGAVKASRQAAAHLRVLDELLPQRNRANLRYIKRTQNLAGIALANLPGRPGPPGSRPA